MLDTLGVPEKLTQVRSGSANRSHTLSSDETEDAVQFRKILDLGQSDCGENGRQPGVDCCGSLLPVPTEASSSEFSTVETVQFPVQCENRTPWSLLSAWPILSGANASHTSDKVTLLPPMSEGAVSPTAPRPMDLSAIHQVVDLASRLDSDSGVVGASVSKHASGVLEFFQASSLEVNVSTQITDLSPNPTVGLSDRVSASIEFQDIPEPARSIASPAINKTDFLGLVGIFKDQADKARMNVFLRIDLGEAGSVGAAITSSKSIYNVTFFADQEAVFRQLESQASEIRRILDHATSDPSRNEQKSGALNIGFQDSRSFGSGSQQSPFPDQGCEPRRRFLFEDREGLQSEKNSSSETGLHNHVSF